MKVVKKIFKIIKSLFYHFFIRQRRFRKRFFLRVKINKLIKKQPVLRDMRNRDKTYLKESEKFLQAWIPGYRNTSWHYAYSSLNGIKSVEYIPEELFFVFIEPALNNKSLKNAYTDKNAYSLVFGSEYLPETVFKIVNGVFYTEESVQVETSDALAKISEYQENLVLKPAIFSGGGKNVVIRPGIEIALLLKENQTYKMDSYILQKLAKQHKLMEQFHPESLNTLRIMTARVRNEIVILSTYFRSGRNKSKIDNASAGGVVCGVAGNGELRQEGIDNNFQKYSQHPDTGKAFEGFKIPGYDRACALCKNYHKKLLHFTFVSWDIGIDDNNQPIFIELNLSMQEVGSHQVNNGPLFGPYTSYFREEFHRISSRKGYQGAI